MSLVLAPRWLALSLAISLLIALPGRSSAQSDPPAPPPPAVETSVDPSSPRAALKEFLDRCREGRYTEAAALLNLTAADAARGPELAMRLKAVLDRHIWFDLETIAPTAEGNLEDGLPPNTEEIARIPGASGTQEPVRLVRRAGGDGWMFGSGTVGRIDAWYDRLDDRWLIELIPAPLLRPGPLDILWWQWLALPLVVLGAMLLGAILQRLTRRILAQVVRRTTVTWDDALLSRLAGPITLGWALAAFYLLLPILQLYQPANLFFLRLVRGGLFAVFFWAISRSIEVSAGVIGQTPWAIGHPASRSLIPLGARVARVVVFAIAIVALLSELGYPVASLVAGLGIGGLALALAAQKTVENLFGAFSLGADEPFRVGDFVKIEDFVGTVETIGLRSTRIRTLDRTLVTIPNGMLADMRLESYTARDRIRLSCVLGLEYATTTTQMRAVLDGLERVLREHPKIWPDAVTVRFRELAAYSLDIEIMAWFLTSNWAEFQAIRQDVLLQFMEVVERAGTGFAFPTQTLHVAQSTPVPAPPPRGK